MKKNLIIIITLLVLGVFGVVGYVDGTSEEKLSESSFEITHEENEEILENEVESDSESEEEIIVENEEVVEDEEEVVENSIINVVEYTEIENLKVVFRFQNTPEAKHYLEIIAYNVMNGEVVWEHVTDEYYVADKNYITYVFDDNNKANVYLLEENNIRLLNMSTGKISWSSKLDNNVNTGVVVNDKLYVMGPFESIMYIINNKTGMLLNSVNAKVDGMDYEIMGVKNNKITIECYCADVESLIFNITNNTFEK